MSAKYSAWKTLERRAAKALKGIRLWRPDYSDSIPDGESEQFVWDAKCYQRHSAITLWLEAWKKYAGYSKGRPLLLVLYSTQNRGAGDFVLIRMKDFVALIDKESDDG